MHDQSSEIQPATSGGSAPVGRYYEVGRRRLLLHRSGSGSPTVVFLPGAGAVGLDYFNVHERAAQLTTSVLYDRAGTGWSDPINLPRTSTEVTDELREVLRAADMPTPYLLVGHSLGGLYARHYAQRFRSEVAGLVLLDPAHEDYSAYMPRQLNEMRSKSHFFRLMNLVLTGALRFAFTRALLLRLPTIQRYRELYRSLFTQEMSDWPDFVRKSLIERHVSLEWLGVGIREVGKGNQLYDEVRHAGPMPDVPLIILCSMGTDGFKQAVSSGESESLLREEIEGKRRLYTDMASSVPRGEVRLVEAGHVTMPFRCPDSVLQAIQDLLVTL